MSSRSGRSIRSGWRTAGTAIIIYVTLCLVAAPATISLENPSAAFLETHLEDQLSLEDYWHAAVSFRELGFVANLLSPYTGFQRIYPENLTDFVSVLLITPRDTLSMGNDIDTIAGYVEGGGGIIIAGQSGTRQYESWARGAVNELTTLFGIEFQRDMVCDPGSTYLSDERYPHWPVITNLEDHEAVRGLEAFSYHSGCSLNVFGNATVVARTSEGGWSDLDGDMELDEGEGSGQRVVAAVSTYGKGRVACIGDNNLWSSRFLDGYENNELLLSLLDWVSQDVPKPDLEVLALDVNPGVMPDEDGNYTASIPVVIWNQGDAAVENITIYLSSGEEIELIGENHTFFELGPDQSIDLDLGLLGQVPDCKHLSLAAEYYEDGVMRLLTLPTIRLARDYDLYHISSIFNNYTEVAYGSPGGWGNYTAVEMETWANETMDLIATNEFEWEVLNHTEVATRTAESYAIKSVHHRRNIVAIGDPESNYVSGYISQKGDLRVLDNETSPVLPSGFSLSSSEETMTSIPRLAGNLSEWGYISLMCEKTFRERSDNRLAAGGFGRQGMETALHALWGLFKGEMEGYREEFSGTFALFRGIYEGEELVGLEFN